VFLISEFDDAQIHRALFSLKSIPVQNLTQALKLRKIDAIYEILTPKRLYYLQQKYKCHLFLYERQNSEIVVVYRPFKIKYEIKIDILLNLPLPKTGNGIIEDFEIILHKSLLPKQFTCEKTKGCSYTTTTKHHFERHLKICGIYNVKQIICKQEGYGDDKSTLKELVQLKIVPRSALFYRNFYLGTFDIETIEEKLISCRPTRGMETKANLKLLSIAVGSNIPQASSKCWVRKSMEPSEESRLVRKFIGELDKLQKLKVATLPNWILTAHNIIQEKIDELQAQHAKYHILIPWFRFRSEINKFMVLDVFGFNCGRFDIPCIAAPLFLELKRRYGKVTILKKMTSYISISTNILRFKDALRFTAPCPYDKFARVWEAPTFKSVWPYSLYGNIVEIKAAKKFPPLSDFASTLKGDAKPDMVTYISAKREFYRRKLLPVNDPDRIKSMLGFLKFYNIQDVGPLAIAIENCFKCYDKYFNVNAIVALSLPSLAQKAMFKNYSIDSPLIYTIDEKNKELNELFRKSVIGGLVNVYQTHVTTYDLPAPVPRAARYAPNGNPFTFILALDVNAMYLGCQGKPLPTSPGIAHEMQGTGKFKKKILCSGHSLKCQQWLCERQAQGDYL
jgi:hypothetical protein